VGEDHVFVDGADVMMRPGSLASRRRRTKAWVRKKAPLRLTLRTASVVFSVTSRRGFDLDAGVVDEDVAAA